MEDYNENHAAPLGYVNAAVAASSQADRQWVLDHLRDIILNQYTDEDEPVIIDKLHRLVEFTSYPTTLQQALGMLVLRQFRTIDLTGVTSIGKSVFSSAIGASLRNVYAPDCTSVGSECFNGASLLTLVLPACTTFGSGALRSIYSLRYVEQKWNQIVGTSLAENMSSVQYLAKLGIAAGQGWNNLTLTAWSPSSVIAAPTGNQYVLDAGAEFLKDGATAQVQTNLDQLNYSVQACIAARLDAWDSSVTDTQPTVTFCAALYNVLSADTLAAFTAKGWNVANAG